MKRSFINQTIEETKAYFASHEFLLPDWATWSKSDWEKNRDTALYVQRNGLGWDVTDFGFEDFEKQGLTLFTLRNGLFPDGYKSYCEKIMHVRKDQVTPYHYHASKVEDIIFRAGKGSFHLAIIPTDSDLNPIYDGKVNVDIDGVNKTFAAEEVITLKQGQSITLMPYQYHKFWSEGGDTMIGEVSTINNDLTDNYFLAELGRYSSIEEDELATFMLCNENKI